MMPAPRPTLAPDAERLVALTAPLDLVLTMAPLAHGHGDPTIRLGRSEVWRATRTPHGPVTLHLRHLDRAVVVRAWGPGAEPAVAHADALIGLEDDPSPLVPRHPVLAELVHRLPGLRLTRTDNAWEALLPAICEQKVTGDEARAAYRAIVRRYGEPAPGVDGMRVAPDPSVLARQPYFALHPLGLERRRAEIVRRAAALVPRLAASGRERALRLLAATAGIGPWTVAETARVTWGDPDAVSVGDYHIPNLVAWALAGERRADDARMLELLEPYRGQRGRVQRLLEASGIRAPRYGPRMPSRRIAGL